MTGLGLQSDFRQVEVSHFGMVATWGGIRIAARASFSPIGGFLMFKLLLGLLTVTFAAHAEVQTSSLIDQLRRELPPQTKPYEGVTHKKQSCQVIVSENKHNFQVTVTGPNANRTFFIDTDKSRIASVYSFKLHRDVDSYVGDNNEEIRTNIIAETGRTVSFQETYGTFAEKSYSLEIKEVKKGLWRVSAGVMSAGRQGFGAISCHISALN